MLERMQILRHGRVPRMGGQHCCEETKHFVVQQTRPAMQEILLWTDAQKLSALLRTGKGRRCSDAIVCRSHDGVKGRIANSSKITTEEMKEE